MTKANITQYDSTPSNNADINDINIAENCPASNINNAIRELMAHLKNVDTGSQALTALSVTGNLTVTGDIVSNTAGTSNFRAGVNAGDAIVSGGNYNTVVGDEAGTAITTADNNTAVGFEAGKAITTNGKNTYIGYQSGVANAGDQNVFVGHGAGDKITDGDKNTIIGKYDGNQGGLDIRTLDNNIVISDGDGNPRSYYRGVEGDWAWKADRTGGYGYIFDNTTSTNPYGLLIRFTNAADDDNNKNFINCSDSSTSRFIVTNQGDVQNHDNSYGAISDEKLKEQITDAASQWEDIKALTIRKYKMKEDVAKGDSDAHWRLGVVAQELETAGMNGLVQESIDTDEEMNDLGTTTKSVKYSILYMKAVKALQEAMTRIETLEAKVTALESK